MDATLVVLAAGLGSRFGGLKQIEPLGKHGEFIADFSAYDALRAGFNKIVYVIKPEIEEIFREKMASKAEKHVKVELAFQCMDDLPADFNAPADRTRPWGTSHALWATRHITKEPFMIISADDFYGRGVFQSAYDFLKNDSKTDYDFAMPGHTLAATVSEHGSVSRAICQVEDEFLTDIREIRKIKKHTDGINYLDEDTGECKPIDGASIVNMLAFAFKPTIFEEIEKNFASFFENKKNPLEGEYFLNSVVKKLIKNNSATMKVLPVSPEDRWMGVTYPEDMQMAKTAIWELISQGHYPEKLW